MGTISDILGSSARTPDELIAKADDLHALLKTTPLPDLVLAYTQNGNFLVAALTKIVSGVTPSTTEEKLSAAKVLLWLGWGK